MTQTKGKIIAVSAPSGTGKTTIVRQLLKQFPELVFSISATTRKKRDDEITDKDYFFITDEEFRLRINNNEFIEWEKVYDYYYGTFRYFIEDTINSGKSVILEIDIKGALEIKAQYPESILIFIYPPSFEELTSRLSNRKTEAPDDFRKRIERAKMELSYKDKFDYLVENKNLEKAVSDISAILEKILTKEK